MVVTHQQLFIGALFYFSLVLLFHFSLLVLKKQKIKYSNNNTDTWVTTNHITKIRLFVNHKHSLVVLKMQHFFAWEYHIKIQVTNTRINMLFLFFTFLNSWSTNQFRTQYIDGSRALYRVGLNSRGSQMNRLIDGVSVYLQDQSICHITLLYKFFLLLFKLLSRSGEL